MTLHIARMLNLAPESGGALVVHTHYVPAFSPTHPSTSQLQRAVCGQFVNPWSAPHGAHSADPTCPNCQTALQDSDIHDGYIAEHDDRVEEDEPLPRRWS